MFKMGIVNMELRRKQVALKFQQRSFTKGWRLQRS